MNPASLGLAGLALGAAVLGGVYFAFSGFVMRALAELPPREGAAAMQHINEVILRSAFMPLFFGTSLGAGAAVVFGIVGWGSPPSGLAILGGALFVCGMFGVTALGNVPLNQSLAEGAGVGLSETWAGYQAPWLRLNHLRTAACLGSAALLAAAAWLEA